ncbi:MAG: hypothetical protein IKD11_01360 [Oscillospiraceae bacterium]|nr:hypothetical protein [Oscillospiraceae bacterium]
MDKIDWKRKLTSRKFWAMVAEFVAMLIIAFGVAEEIAVKITALILAGGGIIAYILGESAIDAAGVEAATMEALPMIVEETEK